ncbi:hypothetical protein FQA47_000463 [Oryzias melastigma]|uniref:Uncharacterized protein n=1 Tax=Oryzias melastigma TaxID=30732 RepID=A0A834FEY2_ORYME|nr:hypothetical protein FQA47_000463 [Oryzias melastigma]
MMIEKRRETAVRGFSKTRTTCSHPHFVSRTHTVKITPKQVELTHTHTCGAVTSACSSEFGMRIICGQRAAELQASTLRSVHSMVTLPKRIPLCSSCTHCFQTEKKAMVSGMCVSAQLCTFMCGSSSVWVGIGLLYSSTFHFFVPLS